MANENDKVVVAVEAEDEVGVESETDVKDLLTTAFGSSVNLGGKEERTHTTTTHTLPMARASAGARRLTTEDGAKSTQTSSSAGSKGVWL